MEENKQYQGAVPTKPKVDVKDTMTTTVNILTGKQFEQLIDTLLYASVIMGVLAAGKTPTATKANLANLRSYVEGVKELMK